MQQDFGHRRSSVGHFSMWQDYLGLRALVARLVHEGDAIPRLQSFTQGTWPDLEERPSCSSDPTTGTFCNSDQSAGGQSLGMRARNSVCGFCKQNGESAQIYTTHRLKSHNGRVTCPILRMYVCPICEATGDKAHTRQYCPKRPRRDVIAPAV